jgi:hypothetical protein
MVDRPAADDPRLDAAVTRRGDPLRVFASQRAGLDNRLTSEGRLSPSSADRWLDVWAYEARARGLPASGHEFWDPAWDWIMEKIGGPLR